MKIKVVFRALALIWSLPELFSMLIPCPVHNNEAGKNIAKEVIKEISALIWGGGGGTNEDDILCIYFVPSLPSPYICHHT